MDYGLGIWERILGACSDQKFAALLFKVGNSAIQMSGNLSS